MLKIKHGLKKRQKLNRPSRNQDVLSSDQRYMLTDVSGKNIEKWGKTYIWRNNNWEMSNHMKLINLFILEMKKGGRAEGENLKQITPRAELQAGLDLMTLGSWLQPKSGVRSLMNWASQVPLNFWNLLCHRFNSRSSLTPSRIKIIKPPQSISLSNCLKLRVIKNKKARGKKLASIHIMYRDQR